MIFTLPRNVSYWRHPVPNEPVRRKHRSPDLDTRRGLKKPTTPVTSVFSSAPSCGAMTVINQVLHAAGLTLLLDARKAVSI